MRLLLGATALAALMASPALAADLRVRGPVYKSPPPVVYNWTGFYGGVNVGYSWGRQSNDWNDSGFPRRFRRPEHERRHRRRSVGLQLAARQLGARHRVQIFRVPPSAAAPPTASLPVAAPAGTTIAAEHKLPWFGTSRTRIGFLPSQYFLIYATGGLAYGQVKSDYALFAGGVGAAQSNFKDTRAGYTVGGGIEGAFGGGWSAKLEYLWVDLGTATSTTTVATGVRVVVDTYSSRVTDSIVRVGLNYKLGGSY